MRCKLFKWLSFLLFVFSTVSYSQEFTIDFSSQKNYVDSLNTIRSAIGTPLRNISQGDTSVSVINHTPAGSFMLINIRGLDIFHERFNNLQFVFDSSNLYVAGFINTATNTFYRFSDFSHISVPGVTTVTMSNDSSYTTLQRIAGIERSGMQINRHSLVSAYLDLVSFSGSRMTMDVSRAMLRFVTVTSEALRFRQIQRGFRVVLDDSAPSYTLSPQDVELTLNWGRLSNILPEYNGESRVRAGRIDFSGIREILGAVAIIFNCHPRELRVSGMDGVNDVCRGGSIKINNTLWDNYTLSEFIIHAVN